MFIKSRILTVLDCIPVVACLLCIRYLEKTFYPGHFSSGKAAAVTLILVFLMAFLYYLAAFTEELGRLLCGLLTGYKFSSFSFGRFTLAKQRGKLRLCRVFGRAVSRSAPRALRSRRSRVSLLLVGAYKFHPAAHGKLHQPRVQRRHGRQNERKSFTLPRKVKPPCCRALRRAYARYAERLASHAARL